MSDGFDDEARLAPRWRVIRARGAHRGWEIQDLQHPVVRTGVVHPRKREAQDIVDGLNHGEPEVQE